MTPPLAPAEGVLHQVATRLSGIAESLARAHGAPVRRDMVTGPVWRFSTEDFEAVEVCKLIRLASGMNAMVVLYDHGFTMDALTLARSSLNFAEDARLMSHAAEGEPEAIEPAKVVASAFFHELIDPDTDTLRAPPIPKRAMVQAALATLLKKRALQHAARTEAPDGATQLIESVEEMRSSRRMIGFMANDFVHQGYDVVMSMYDPSTNRFETRGTKSETLLRNCRQQLIGVACNAMVAFAVATSRRGMIETAKELHALHEALGHEFALLAD
jgi:hypothetical protein